MPCRPSTSVRSTRRPPVASATASDAATVVLPVPPLPVTTCRRTSRNGCACVAGRSSRCAVTRRPYPPPRAARPVQARRKARPPQGPKPLPPVTGLTYPAPVTAVIVVLVVLVVIGLVLLITGVKVVQQYERGVAFRLGIDRLTKVNMQIVTMGVPAQEGITRDNVTLRVDAVVYFRVVDPIKAIVNVHNYRYAVSQVAQTSLRSVIGRSDMDDMLSNRNQINAELRSIIDEPTEDPWGVKIERVEIKDVALPETMKRSMSRQAEAERERRARVIAADGEYQASKKLADAGRTLRNQPSAMQLRLLQTVVEVAAEKNSTLVMPFSVEMLRFFDRLAAASDSGPSKGLPEPEPAEPSALGDGEVAIPPPPVVPPVPGRLTERQHA